MLKIAPLLVAFLLAGCATTQTLQPTDKSPVCKALIGPIKYNSTNPKSARHAGPKLAPDLKARNQVGSNLNCPQYR